MIKISTLLLALLLPNIALAGFYKCKDASGHVTYSDAPCAASALVEANPKPKPPVAATESAPATHSLPPVKESYTKDMPALQSNDAATKSCFNAHNTTQNFPDPTSSKLLATRKNWVTVKDVGARQMVTIEVTSKNTAGMYVGRKSFDCLLMGDGVTVNTKPAEIL
jgi:hypothetical protein